jgi:hypothetical protein
LGNELHWSKSFRSFTDFLLQLIKKKLGAAFGPGWYQSERAKAAQYRHPIVRWYEAFCALGEGLEKNEKGMYEAEPDGPTMAYLTLAYDIFVVGDNAKLEAELLRRLREPNDFSGARYELAVAATMIRAGFRIEFEDETDSTRKHPEFVAVQLSTNDRVAVEAKARRRRGVMGWVGPRPDPRTIRLSIDALLRSAAEKSADLPLIVFVDANMPPDMANEEVARWVSELNESLPRVAHGFNELGVHVGAPFCVLALTNWPFDYVAPGEPPPKSIGYISEPMPARHPLPNATMSPAIELAIRQFGMIPSNFPDTSAAR